MAYYSKGRRLAHLVQNDGLQQPPRGMCQATKDALERKKRRDEELRLLVQYEALKSAEERRQLLASGKENMQTCTFRSAINSTVQGTHFLNMICRCPL